MAKKFNARLFKKDVQQARAQSSRKVSIQTTTGVAHLLVPAGLRIAAKEIGISAPTLSRVQRGGMPDIETFGKLCSWMQESPSKYFRP